MDEPRVVAVMGLQWGSEAKGSIASMIAHKWEPDVVAAAWHPNAGHTAYIGQDKFVHSMLPMGALAPSVKTILLGPGSVIDLAKLKAEIEGASAYLKDKLLVIHPQAACLSAYDREDEQSLVSIGSTMKGSMRATIRKMGRGTIYPDVPPIIGATNVAEELDPLPAIRGFEMQVSENLYDRRVDNAKRLLLEGAQGFGLGIHTEFYPFCTSRDVSPAQLLADCRVPVQPISVVGVCRTYPIRVANRFDKEGKQIGTSGHAYERQDELNWVRDLGREPELTTVTKLPRRVFQFSMKQIWEACRIVRPTAIALTFCDYMGPAERRNGDGRIHAGKHAWILAQAIKANCSRNVRWMSYGPHADDIWQVSSETGLLTQPQVGVIW